MKAYCHVPRPATWCSPACAALDSMHIWNPPLTLILKMQLSLVIIIALGEATEDISWKGPIGPYFPLGP